MTKTKINYKDKSVDDTTDLKLLNAIERIAKKSNFLKHKISITTVPPNGLSYLGELKKVNIKGETVDGEKNINIFVKSKFPDSENIKELSMHDIYCNELFVYKVLSKIYGDLQKESNVPIKERYDFVTSYDESDTDSILMEDIANKGFVTYKKIIVITIDFAEKCIEKLSKFHALSFVLQEKQPKIFNETLKEKKYPLTHSEDFSTFLDKMKDFCIKQLDGQRKDKLIKFGLDLDQKYQTRMNGSTKVRCLCHGDFRAQNIMMKASNGEAFRVMPIDYQFIFYGSPVTDIIYFIFGSTDREFRKKHLENLKNLYYDVMTNFLKYFNMNIDNVYPRDIFDKTFQESLDLGLMMSLWYLPINMSNDNEVALNKKSLSDTEFSVNEKLKSRLEDVIDDLTEWGHL